MSKNEELISIAKAAELTGYSRQHILRLVNAGEIPAKRVGRSFVIVKKHLPGPFGSMNQAEKSEIDKAVGKIFKSYGETIKELGKE